MTGNHPSKISSAKVKSEIEPVRRDYCCADCPAKFKRIAAYRGHMKNAHKSKSEDEVDLEVSDVENGSNIMSEAGSSLIKSEEGSFKREYCCSCCPAKLNKIKDYREHMKNEHSIKSERINVTYRPVNQTPSLSLFNKQLPESNIPNSLVCPNCSKMFLKVGSFRRHLRSHLNLPSYCCRHCVEKFFFKKEQLLAHIQVQHQGEKKIKCHMCDELFYNRSAFYQHCAVHLKESPYKCHMCDGIFRTSNRLLRHKTFHTHICPFCKKLFQSRQTIINHILMNHRDADFMGFINEPEYKPLETKFAKNSSDSFDELWTETDADSYTSDDNIITARKIKQEKKKTKRRPCIVCFICERRFPSQKHLEFHMKYHLIFPCKYCPKFFADEASLQAHTKQHFRKKAKKYQKPNNSVTFELSLPNNTDSD